MGEAPRLEVNMPGRTALAVLVIVLCVTRAGGADYSLEWEARYDGPRQGVDEPWALAIDDAGNVIVTGTSWVTGYYDQDFATVKYNASGAETWSRAFDGTAGRDDYARGVAVDELGCVYVAGSSNQSAGYPNWDIVTVKYFPSGDVEWLGRFEDDGCWDTPVAVELDGRGGVYVAGTVAGHGQGPGGPADDLITLRFDWDGQLLWARRYDGPYEFFSQDVCRGMAVDLSGNVTVTGESYGADGVMDCVTIKYSPAGDELWVARADGPNGTPLYAVEGREGVATDGSGNVFVTGTCGTGDGQDYLTISYDPGGNLVWSRLYDGPDHLADEPIALATDAAGNVYVTGISYSAGPLPAPVVATVKYTPLGDVAWVRRYAGSPGLPNEPRSAAVASNGNVYITGFIQSSTTGSDFLTLAYSGSGTLLWHAAYDGPDHLDDEAGRIAVDAAGNVYVSGFTVDETGGWDYLTLKYAPAEPWPSGWVEMESIPSGPQKRGIRDGAWLAHKPLDRYVYAIKGDRTEEFYRYDVKANAWQPRAPIPEGREGKLPFFGARGVQDDSVYIYATKGHETPGFWRYDIPPDTWTQLADVPERPVGDSKVADGTDLTFVPYDSGGGRKGGHVYLLKGRSGEFYRYCVNTEQWEECQHAPPRTGKTLWKAGSFITYDGNQTIYAHRSFDRQDGGSGNETWTFDLVGQTWGESPLPGMPGDPPTVSQDGGCGDWWDGSIFALKGGDTDEFWQYTPNDQWNVLDPMPKMGSSGKERGVFWGADIISHGCGAFFAFKGHDTPEFWRYVLAPKQSGGTQGSLIGDAGDAAMSLTTAPSPLAGRVLNVRYSLAQPGRASISLFDMSGRVVVRRPFLATRSGQVTVDIRDVSAGVYLIRLDDGLRTVSRKLVVQR